MKAIIDCDIGGLGAVANMLRRLGVAHQITSERDAIARTHCFFSLVGDQAECMARKIPCSG